LLKTFSLFYWVPLGPPGNPACCKGQHKIYARHSGYVGGQTIETPNKVRQRRPELILEWAVKGMVPKNKLGSAQMKKLKVYAGEEHPHEAQEPQPVIL
jgi:large subunit ribosomal protein L13